MSLEDELFDIEIDFWTGGPEAYRRHADQRCLVVFSEMAGVMSNEDIAKSAEKGRWSDVAVDRKGFVQLTDASAMISYECHAKRKDGAAYRALIGSGYARRPDGWKLAFHQQTPLRA